MTLIMPSSSSSAVAVQKEVSGGEKRGKKKSRRRGEFLNVSSVGGILCLGDRGAGNFWEVLSVLDCLLLLFIEGFTSLVVAAIKRLLPIGLNVFGGPEQELVQLAKEKMIEVSVF